jgi:hypothetical protein
MKRKVEKVIDDIHYRLEGSIEAAILYLQEMKAEADEKGVTYHLDYTKDYGSWGDPDRDIINLIEKREETDEEYQARLEKEQADKAASLDSKRKQLEQLKKELGEE